MRAWGGLWGRLIHTRLSLSDYRFLEQVRRHAAGWTVLVESGFSSSVKDGANKREASDGVSISCLRRSHRLFGTFRLR